MKGDAPRKEKNGRMVQGYRSDRQIKEHNR